MEQYTALILTLPLHSGKSRGQYIYVACGITLFISTFSSSPHTAACRRMALGTTQHDKKVFAHRKNPLWPRMDNFLVYRGMSGR